MFETVARQQELRLRLMAGAYQGFVRDPNAFHDLVELDVLNAPILERLVDDEDSTPPPDFTAAPPDAAEIRAAAFYLLERGLLTSLPAEALQAQHLEPDTIMLHITANGVDALETFVTANHLRASERPVGFLLASDAERMVGMPRAQKVAALGLGVAAEQGTAPLETAPREKL
jgi:hypothetical protein